MAEVRIDVDGVDAILARLDRLPSRAEAELWQALEDVAGVNALRIRVDAARAGRQAQRAAGSVHAEGTAIVGGGPFFMGSVFGGQGRPTTRQFRPYRAEGYWFWPTLRAQLGEAMDRVEAALDRAVGSV